MKYFTLLQADNRAGEIFPEFIDIEAPGVPTESDPSPPARLRSVPLEERYTTTFIASLLECAEGTQQGYIFENGEFSPPPPYVPPAPSAAQVMAGRAQRMVLASAEIAPLQDLVELGEASEDDEGKLLEWKQYRAVVSKVQTQPGFPGAVVWPEPPAI